MRGFLKRVPCAEAIAWVMQLPIRFEAESVPLAEATGRVLLDDLVAPLNVPGFDRSAMDGFAVRGAETIGASDYAPISIRVIGTAMPGVPFSGELSEGESVRIMTGAPIPAGCDAVVPAEYARIIETSSSDQHLVEITAAVAEGKHISRVGEDIRDGSSVLSAGRILRPQDVAVVASLGIGKLTVCRRPRVRLLVTGDELATPGHPKGDFQTYDANSFLLRPLVTRDGGVWESIRYLKDDRKSVRDALSEPGADVILISGGSSVGSEDHAPMLVAEVGELSIHGIAMRPSSPAGMGRVGEALVFLLPGNPVSCLCAYDFFAGRAIRRLGGRAADWPHRRHVAKLARKLVSQIGRTDYCRVLINDAGLEPLALSGASILSSTTRADGFVIVPSESEGFPPGAEVEVFLYDA